jgi:universal stress protein E
VRGLGLAQADWLSRLGIIRTHRDDDSLSETASPVAEAATAAPVTVAEVGSSIPADAEALLVRDRHDRLATIAAAVESMPIEFDVLRGRPSMALVQEVLRSSHDLLIRSHARDLAAPRALRTIDRELFRQCPCPVWAVGPGLTSAPRRVLAALRARRSARR